MNPIGIVKLEALKRLAKVLRKAIPGCKHTHALENLARASGMKNYNELCLVAMGYETPWALMEGSHDELVYAWTSQLSAEFRIDITSVLSIDEIDVWFGRVFASRDRLMSDAESAEPSLVVVRDPQLEAANWRDAEFRQWVQGAVEKSARRTSKTSQRDWEDREDDLEEPDAGAINARRPATVVEE